MQFSNIRTVLFLASAGAALALAVGRTGGIAAGETTQPTPTPPHDAHKAPASAPSVDETARARLAAAERTCKILHDVESGTPRGHQGVEHTYLWSKRRMEAEIDVERTGPGGGDGGVAAIQRHAEWMRAWHEQVVKSGAFSGFDVASAEYYVAEAEDLLARAKAR